MIPYLLLLEKEEYEEDGIRYNLRYNPITDKGECYYSTGGKNVTSTPIKTDGEAFAELSKALHAFGAIDHTCILTNDTWTATDGTYIIAADLESMAHKSKLTESGINTLSSNTHLITKFGVQIPTNKALLVDTFVYSDAILLFQNGVCSV